ncbi:MAG: hypothetical protein HKN87_00230 [Saprospiraceae bacterium]|nr:hypothetical protein [Saprospiraceae bacterium]
MKNWILVFGQLFVFVQFAQAQEVTTGKFCLEYFPQPKVETYVDSLVSYLSREMGGDTIDLDETTLDYIEHFASIATYKSKCVFFDRDSIMIHEKVDQELTNTYLIIPSENKLISRVAEGLKEQTYFIEGSTDTGYMDYEIQIDKSDTKSIEGFLCYKTIVTEKYFAPGEEEPREKDYTLYVTDELVVAGGFVLGINMSRVIGCPLEIQEPLNSKINITYRATGLRLKAPDGIFRTL